MDGRPAVRWRSLLNVSRSSLQGPMLSRSTSRKTVVGLEIEPSHLAAAEVRPDTAAVERAATAMLPPGVVRDGEVVVVDAISEALK